jgi:hypothetical protein
MRRTTFKRPTEEQIAAARRLLLAAPSLVEIERVTGITVVTLEHARAGGDAEAATWITLLRYPALVEAKWNRSKTVARKTRLAAYAAASRKGARARKRMLAAAKASQCAAKT